MTTAAPTPAPSEYERTDARALTLPLVIAQFVQNIGGGLGAGVAVAALQWLAHIPLESHWRWPLGVAVFVAGASTAVRAYLDEYRSSRDWWQLKAQHAAEMGAVCTDLEEAEEAYRAQGDAYRALLRDYERAEREIESLRLANVRHMAAQASRADAHRPVQDLYPAQTRDDARALLAQWYAQHKWPGERSVEWPRQRHAAARDLLRRAGLVSAETTATATRPPHNEAWAVARLDAYLGAARDAVAAQRGLENNNAVDAVVQSAGEGD